MSVLTAILSNFTAFIMSVLLTLIPYAGVKMPVIDTLKDDAKLTVELISDTHFEEYELLRWAFLKTGLTNMKYALCKIDALVVAGDITNYADEPTLAKYYETIKKYSPVPVITAAGNHDIGHAGDRDVTDISREEAMANFIKYNNEYMGTDFTTNYYATEINGYKFIVIGDEVLDGGHWDAISMSEEQLIFLDEQLAEGTKDNKPVFVVSHWPIESINGEDTIWPGSGIELAEYDIPSVLEKYNNVYWISGHMHAGVKATAVEDIYDLSSAEQVNGVTYLNLPTFGIVNMFGLTWSGTGAQLEVYDDEVVYRPRNLLNNNWYENAEYHFPLTGNAVETPTEDLSIK